MTRFVLVHGAFRGGWSWAFVADRLRHAGHTAIMPDLPGMGQGPQVATDTTIRLDQWVRHIAELIDDEPAVVVGHSMGGIVAQGAGGALGPRLIERLVLLDAPRILHGQRPVDVSSASLVDEAALPSGEMWLPPTPVGAPQGFVDEMLAQWTNARLCSTPFQPSLDRIVIAPQSALIPTTWVFCTHTPEHFPSALTRASFTPDEYTLIDSHHDAPLLRPDLVAALLLRL